MCGACDDDPDNDCDLDECGTWGGTGYFDNCATCDNNSDNDSDSDSDSDNGVIEDENILLESKNIILTENKDYLKIVSEL